MKHHSYLLLILLIVACNKSEKAGTAGTIPTSPSPPKQESTSHSDKANVDDIESEEKPDHSIPTPSCLLKYQGIHRYYSAPHSDWRTYVTVEPERLMIEQGYLFKGKNMWYQTIFDFGEAPGKNLRSFANGSLESNGYYQTCQVAPEECKQYALEAQETIKEVSEIVNSNVSGITSYLFGSIYSQRDINFLNCLQDSLSEFSAKAR